MISEENIIKFISLDSYNRLKEFIIRFDLENTKRLENLYKFIEFHINSENNLNNYPSVFVCELDDFKYLQLVWENNANKRIEFDFHNDIIEYYISGMYDAEQYNYEESINYKLKFNGYFV